MKKPSLLFCIAVIVVLSLMLKVPRLFFPQFEKGETSWYFSRLPFILFFMLGFWLYAQKKAVLAEGGFIKPIRRNYWMLLIPILYPGILYLSGKTANCLVFDVNLVSFVCYVLAAALLEEVVFRGAVQGYLIKYETNSKWYAVPVISSIFFALMHLSNLQYYEPLGVILQVVYAFFIGLLLSAINLRIRNVWLLGLAHGVLNLCSKGLCKDVEREFSTSESGGFVNYLMGIGGLILLNIPVLIIYYVLLSGIRRKSQIQEAALPPGAV